MRIRSCTTTCRRWMMTTSAAADRLATRCMARRSAILVGDALQARAFEILASEISPPERAAQCCAVLGRAAGATALVGGQAADLAEAESPSPQATASIAVLEAIHRRKTGALFVASLELGGIVAGGTAEQVAALVEFGQKLGLAFQITDDLLDVTGQPGGDRQAGGQGRRPRQADVSQAAGSRGEPPPGECSGGRGVGL